MGAYVSWGIKRAVEKAKEKRTKPITQDRLMRAALHYLGRFESSTSRLTEVLERKVKRWSGEGAGHDVLIANTVAKCLELDLVNDARYAKMRSDTLVRRGKAPRVIAQDLAARGIDRQTIEGVLDCIGQEDTRGALATLARRRRLGLFRGHSEEKRRAQDERKWRDKELSALMRAGHSFSDAAAFLALQTPEELEDWLAGD